MNQKTTFIYSLEYPEGNIRYIGKSNNPKKRLNSHVGESKKNTTSHKKAWINSLVKQELTPILNIVDEVLIEEWSFWEKYYISLYRTWEFNLTNELDGGDGVSFHTKETRAKISKGTQLAYDNGFEPWNKGLVGISIGYPKGKKRSKEECANMSIQKKEYYKENDTWNKGKQTGQIPWNKGKVDVYSEETLQKMSTSLKGREVWNKGVPMSAESKKKCSENSTYSRSVMQFTLEGEFIKTFISAKQAIDEINCNGVNICCNGFGRSAGGFIWAWKDEYSESLIQKKVLKLNEKIEVSEETKLKISRGRKGKTSGENHPFFNKNHSDETVSKITETLINKPFIECTHCGKESRSTNFKKYHLDNCLKNPNIDPSILVKCPYCDTISNNETAMKRWHFNNCKHK